jgi:hypothetical protein
MIGFLNERSLEEHGNWSVALQFFLAAAQELSPAAPTLFRDSVFFSQAHFKQRFNSLSLPKDQRALILELVFGSRYYKCWRPERLSGEHDDYASANPALQLRDESISEATEQKIRDTGASVSLLSAPDSAFGNIDPIAVAKVRTEQAVQLNNASSVDAIRRWIVSKRGHYDPTSSAAPRDFQTILVKASQRFRITNKVERRFSRRVFEEITTSRLYYVDDGHPGHSAHLEVFSANCEHLGTADIETGTLNVADRKPGRTLKL